MNEQDFSAGLRAVHLDRTMLPDVDTVHEQLLALPFQDIPYRRGFLLPILTDRFQAMFSATKFVVAGVIVALFGGFLLAGVLTTQRSEESLPVGASASAEATPLQRVRVPAELPDDARSGTLDTPLGPARWVHIQGLPDGLIEDGLQPAPEGFVFLDYEEPPMLWRSPDLIGWTSEPLPMDVERAELALEDGTYWLSAAGLPGLWRSEDTVTWQQIDVSALVSPFPEWLVPRPSLDEPISSAGVTIVPFGFRPDPTLSDLGLPGLPGDWRLFESAEPGIYEATRTKVRTRLGVHARLRFEETDTGLRVIDADDGTELAELDGVGLDFIEGWARRGWPAAVFGLAIVEDDTLVPVEPPGSPDQDLRVFGTEAGFFAYRHAPDSDLVHVWLSGDGVTWSESQALGDEPGEPTGVDRMELDERWAAVVARQAPVGGERDGRGWTSSDGVTWQELPWPEPGTEEMPVRMASGWLTISWDELSFKRSGVDAWATTDVTELGIEIDDSYLEKFGPGLHVNAISPDTIALQVWSPTDPYTMEPEYWIITFDDLGG